MNHRCACLLWTIFTPLIIHGTSMPGKTAVGKRAQERYAGDHMPVASPEGKTRYLVEDLEVVYLSTCRDLARLHLSSHTGQNSNTALLIGHPDFRADTKRLTSIVSQLKSSQQAIASNAGATGILSQCAERTRIIEFATHGYYMHETSIQSLDPWMRSMLILAGVDSSLGRSVTTPLGDGILTAYEILGLDLRGTELVNLMVSESGLGEIRGREGVISLGSAFQIAGARTIISSLWEIPMMATFNLMEDFHKRWIDRDASSACYPAFRQAQLNMIQNLRTENGAAHPFYWAAFIYAGDPGDLIQPRQEK